MNRICSALIITLSLTVFSPRAASAVTMEPPVTLAEALHEIDAIRSGDLDRTNALLGSVLEYYKHQPHTEETIVSTAEKVKKTLAPGTRTGYSVKADSQVQVNSASPEKVKESKSGTVAKNEKDEPRERVEVNVEKTGHRDNGPGLESEKKAAVNYVISPATTVKVDTATSASGSSSGTFSVVKKLNDATSVEVTGKETKGTALDSTAALGGTVRRQLGKNSTVAVSAEKEKVGDVPADTYGVSLATKVGKKTEVELSARDRVAPGEETNTYDAKAQQALSEKTRVGVTLESSGSDRGKEAHSSTVQLENRVGTKGLLTTRYGIAEENDVKSSLAAVNYETNLRKYLTLFGGFEQHMAATPKQKAEVGVKAGKESDQFGVTLSGEKEDSRLQGFLHRLFLMYVKKF
jgi:hypothetical protein